MSKAPVQAAADAANLSTAFAAWRSMLAVLGAQLGRALLMWRLVHCGLYDGCTAACGQHVDPVQVDNAIRG